MILVSTRRDIRQIWPPGNYGLPNLTDVCRRSSDTAGYQPNDDSDDPDLDAVVAAINPPRSCAGVSFNVRFGSIWPGFSG